MNATRLAIAALVLLSTAWFGVARGDTPEEIFDRGNTAYENGEYPEAAEAYRAVLRYRVRDPAVEYNLGNAEFRLGNLGLAIAHFERARRLDPTDGEILANLDYARTFCFDRVESPELAAPLRWLYATQDRLGPDVQGWIVVLMVWLIGIVVALGLSRRSGFQAGHGWVLTILIVALAVSAGSWNVTYDRLEGRRLAVVLDDIVEIHAGPGPNNPALFTVHEGLTLEVRAEREEWIQVSLPNGLSGWVARSAVEPV